MRGSCNESIFPSRNRPLSGDSLERDAVLCFMSLGIWPLPFDILLPITTPIPSPFQTPILQPLNAKFDG